MLDRVAHRVWGELIDKLDSGQPYRIRRTELPTGHALRRQGHRMDLLVLDGDTLKVA